MDDFGIYIPLLIWVHNSLAPWLCLQLQIVIPQDQRSFDVTGTGTSTKAIRECRTSLAGKMRDASTSTEVPATKSWSWLELGCLFATRIHSANGCVSYHEPQLLSSWHRWAQSSKDIWSKRSLSTGAFPFFLRNWKGRRNLEIIW